MRALSMIAGALLLSATAALAFDGTLKIRTVGAPMEALASGKDKKPDTATLLAMMPADLLAKAGDQGAQQEATVYVSGNKVRMDAPVGQGQDGSVIVFENGTTWLVSPEEKQYIEWTQADAKIASEKMAAFKKALREQLPLLEPAKRKEAEAVLERMEAGEKKPAINLTPLGKTQTISGMQTAAYKAVDGSSTVVGWITEEQPELSEALRTVTERMRKVAGPATQKPSVRELMQGKGLPVMVQTVEPEGYRIEEILSIEAKPVPASLFAAPKNFKKISGTEVLNQMMGGPPPPGANPPAGQPGGGKPAP